MNTPDPRKALEALASAHGLPILRYLQGRDWALASQVADALAIHTTTASKHLAAFHAAGFLERRPHAAKRPTFAYRLRSPVIRIELDLGERVGPPEMLPLAAAFLESLLGAVGRMGGPRLAEGLAEDLLGAGDWRRGLGDWLDRGGDARAALEALVAEARTALGSLVGPAAAGRLVRMAWDAAAEGRADVVAAVRLPEVVP